MVKIVVIEDEVDSLSEVVTWLQAEGYEVTGTRDGKLGLQTIHEEIPDLIVCDITMPEMDGHEILIEVRSTRSLNHIPFVFLAHASDRVSVRKGMNLGADDYLTKPITRAEVLSTVQSRLYKQSVQDAQAQTLINILNQTFSEERAQRLLKSRMIAMFSHDFRNPLTAVLSSSNILRNYEDRLSPAQKTQHLDRIDGSVHLLIQMLEDMMTVAELEEGQLKYVPQLINLAVFVEAITEEFRLIDQGIHILTVHTTLQGLVEADSKLLRQILANLISNAIKYSPPDSEITITLSDDSHRINLSVRDQGIGIPPDGLSHVFEPFYRANNVERVRGTGLGLSIVRDCVERHNGHIEVASQVGEGTTFIVDLPLVREQPLYADD